MTDIDISPSTAQRLKQLSEQQQLSVDEMLTRLLEQYSIPDSTKDEAEWDDRELAELFQTGETLTGREIVQKHLASGVIGSWADMGIEDSVEWLNQEKAKRQHKRQW